MDSEQTIKHTPGPWVYFEQRRWRSPDTYGCVRGPDFVILNGCAPGGQPVEQKANARLMGSAPALLETAQLQAKHIQVLEGIIEELDSSWFEDNQATYGAWESRRLVNQATIRQATA